MNKFNFNPKLVAKAIGYEMGTDSKERAMFDLLGIIKHQALDHEQAMYLIARSIGHTMGVINGKAKAMEFLNDIIRDMDLDFDQAMDLMNKSEQAYKEIYRIIEV